MTEKGSEKWTSDGYEILEEISRVAANEDAPIHLNNELSPSVYFRHVDGSETCLKLTRRVTSQRGEPK